MNDQQLADLQELHLLKARYFRFLDTREWTAFRELFADGFEYFIENTQVSDVVGGVAGAATFASADALIDYLQHSDPDRRSVHHGHMPEIEFVDADTATGIWAVAASTEYPNRGFTTRSQGHYFETYRRGADGTWRIQTIRLRHLRFQSDPLPVVG